MKQGQKHKALILAGLLCFFAAGQAFAQTGVIKELSGTVELKRAGQAAFVPARAGDTVARDTIVSTGFKSTALIAIGSSVITVRPLTRLSLAELSSSAGTETINLNLQAGRVRVDVTPPAGTRTNMTVRSPSATASVRGTGFDFDTRRLAVQKGIVVFQGKKGRPMLVSSGSTSQVRKNDNAADPIVTSAAALMPVPPAGTDSGKHHDDMLIPKVEFAFTLNFN
ncbi:MAG: FecR family protein [Treponema sp.]|jgi:hypothetical protein|nr:FecR family protein [Treponema sp.]